MGDYSLVEAARRLGTTTEAVRARVKRKSLEGYRDNRGRWRVRLSGDQTNDWTETQHESSRLSAYPQTPSEHDRMLVQLRERVAWLEGKLEGVEGRLADRDRELAEVKAERDRLLVMLGEAQAVLARRPQGTLSRFRDRLFGSRNNSKKLLVIL